MTVTRKIRIPLPVDTARRRLELFSLMPCAAIDGPMVLAAVGITDRCQLSYCDAPIIAAASASGAKLIYSEDLSNGQDYPGARVVNPFAPV